MVNILRLTHKQPEKEQDKFFRWSMVILPIIAQSAYIFDAFYYLTHQANDNTYEGLLSTILMVFAYLRYCSPIENRLALFIYYILLCILNEIGTIGYMICFILKKNCFSIIIYCFRGLIELIMSIMLIYCRIVMRYEIKFIVENKHLFHFMSRLETILAIFIPIFISKNFTTITRDSIAFFLLFDFFSGSYVHFQGVWIKSTLYIFVATVTTTVATEWLYIVEKKHFYEQIAVIHELISVGLCNSLIILQFFPYHFMPIHITKIARDGFIFQQRLSLDLMHKNQTQIIDIEKSNKISIISDSNC